MKYILILSLLAISNLFNNAQAVTIDIIQQNVAYYANGVTGSVGDYYDTAANYFAGTPLSEGQLSAAVTGNDLTKYAWTPDANLNLPTDPSYVSPNYIELNFGDSINAYNGDSADIVLFFAGNANLVSGDWKDYLFSVEIGNVKKDGLTVIRSDTSDIYNYELWASYALIDLTDFGFAANASADDIRVFLGDTSMPALAAVGAYNATVVPLPLSSVLFGSGLALLSLFRRKKA